MSLSDPFADFPSWKKRGESRKPPKEYLPPNPAPLNRQQTWRWLAHVKSDDWWRSQMPVSYSAISLILGLPETWIANMMAGDPTRITTRVIPKIARLIPDIESRKLCFPKLKTGPRKGIITPKYLWLNPEETIIPRLSRAWSLWARCGACGNNKFLPVVIDAKPHVACYHCLPPSQHRAIGAVWIKNNLVHEALKKYY